MSILAKGLTKYYGEQAAVKDLSFSVAAGEVVGFLGPNGAGKSTTMKMLSGYIPPSEGTASVAGADILDAGDAVRRKVGYLPENNPLYGEMFVREYLDYIAGLNGIKQRKQRIEELLELTGLLPECNKPIGALSKGYKQRVGLAQALIKDPEVLILDEPTSGLDPNQLVDIRALIKRIGREKTVLLSTHIMQEVEQMCDRVLIIKNGVLVADESVKVLSGARGAQCLMEVTFENPVTDEALTAAGAEVHERLSDKRLVVRGKDAGVISQQLFRFCSDTGNTILHLSELSKNLESVFRELTSDKK